MRLIRRRANAVFAGIALLASSFVVFPAIQVDAGTVRAYNVHLQDGVSPDVVLEALGVATSRTSFVFDGEGETGVNGFTAKLTSKEVATLNSRSDVLSVALDRSVSVDSVVVDADTNFPNQSTQSVGDVIPGQYIVQMKDDATRSATDQVVYALGESIIQSFDFAIHGYVARLSEDAAKQISEMPGVAFVEKDRVVGLVGEQLNPPWGLDRIDQRDRPTNGRYTYEGDGTGVNVYVIDTGLDASNQQFDGRVTSGFSSLTSDSNSTDCNGHGTHVAGTVGATTYGVAKGATIIPIKVLDCNGSGTTSGVISGINWAIEHHTGSVKAVANLSLGGGFSSSLNTAINNLVNDGVVVVVAAGNETTDACTKSPASAPAALTVGATDSSDVQAWFSNYGSCLDVYAPGVSILSSTLNGSTGSWSGTSMASPHVAGAAAVVWGQNPDFTRAQVSDFLITNATTGKVTSIGTGSPNRLLFLPSNGNSPSAPSKPTATLQDEVVTVEWSAPSSIGSSPIIGYSATSSVGNFTCDTDAVTTSCSFTTLPPGAYTFSVVAHNSVGASPASPPSDLVVISGTNDMFADASEIAGPSGSVMGDNSYASREVGEPLQAVGSGGASIWYRYRPAESGTLALDLSGSAFDTVLEVFGGNSVSQLSRIAFDDDGGTGLTSRLTINATRDVTYHIRISSYASVRGTTQLEWLLRTGECVVGQVANDSFCRAEELVTASGEVSVDATGATSEYGEPDGIAGTKPVWYRYTPNVRGTLDLSTLGSNFDTVLAVFTGQQMNDLSLISFNDDGNSDRTSRAEISVQENVTYFIAVGGFAGGTGWINLSWDFQADVIPSAPTSVRAIPRENSALVSWTAPSAGATPDVTYRVTAIPGGNACVVESVTQCEVTGLVAGGTYSFTVTASNALGTGPASSPSAPVVLATDSESKRFAVAWGVDRIDQRSLPLDGFITSENTGTDVRVYVVDTGIRTSHVEFSGRVAPGISTVPGSLSVEDCHGHGTHVASTSAGSTFGVAPGATIVPVRVLDCEGWGTTSQIVAGLDWIRTNMRSGERAVVNMSLGGASKDSLMIAAVEALIDAGAVVVAASGNSGSNACMGSPAGIPSVITVAASGADDRLAVWSNYGSCVDIVAPGVEILGASSASQSASTVMSGTSMAAPHVSGVVAVLQSAKPSWTPSQIASSLISSSTKNVLTGELNNTPNRMLFIPHTACDIVSSLGQACEIQSIVQESPVVTPVPVLVPAPQVVVTRTTTVKRLLRRAGIRTARSAKVRLRVLRSSRRICTVQGQRVLVRRSGTCQLSVRVKAKRGRAVTHSVVISAVKKSSR